jgi:hypothetical protein
MKKNLGTLDKALRIISAIALVALYLTGLIRGTLGIIILLIAAMFLVTSILGICPLYPLFGWNTRKKAAE